MATIFGAVVSLAGCGASSVTKPVGAMTNSLAKVGKSMAGAVKKPLSSLKNSGPAPDATSRSSGFEDRTANDEYGSTSSTGFGSSKPTAPENMYDPSSEQAEKSVLKKEHRTLAHEDKGEAKNLRRSLSGELESLREQEKRLHNQLEEYKNRARESEEMRELYTEQLKKTHGRIDRVEGAMEWIERDPGAFSRGVSEGTSIGQYNAGKSELKAAPDGVMSGGPEASDWRSVSGSGAADKWKPPVLRQKTEPAEWQGRPEVTQGPVSPPGMVSMRERVSITANEKPAAQANGIATSVLAVEGVGRDAQLMLGAGRNSGVKPGMTFKTSNGAILVVTDIYPTMAKAYLHPQYASSKIQPNARVVQIPSLPGK